MKINRLFALITCCLLATSAFAGATYKKRPIVLIFCKTNGDHHASIPIGITAIRKLGAENGFLIETTTDSLRFTQSKLKKYSAIIFLNATGEVLGKKEEAALRHYVEHGGGFVGVHAAADCESDFPWYAQMLGARFSSHPKQQSAKMAIVDKKHASTATLPSVWEHFDEWYNFKDINPNIEILVRVDEASYEGGTNGVVHPITWYHAVGKGRSWYTALGHTAECYSDQLFLTHLLGGIHYALGLDE